MTPKKPLKPTNAKEEVIAPPPPTAPEPVKKAPQLASSQCVVCGTVTDAPMCPVDGAVMP